jgi:hypothetical protein
MFSQSFLAVGTNSVVIHVPKGTGSTYASMSPWSSLSSTPILRDSDFNTWGVDHPALSLVADL